MSIQAPQGILNIPNATLRVGKLAVDEVVGADTILNTVARNTILLVDDEAYHENKNWALKLPNAWAGEFECNTASAGNYSEFNFYNEGASSNVQGYNLTFNDTAVELRYDGTLLKTGTLASTITGTGVKKVRLMFERTILSVTVDGTLVFTHDDTGGPRPRVYSTTAGGFLNFFTDGGALKNLKIVNEKWMSDGTSNIAYVGGGEVAVGKALAFNRVSNVSQIKVDANVVTEYTGPHDRPLRKYPEVAMTANDNSSTSGYVADTSSESGTDTALRRVYTLFDHVVPDGSTTDGWMTGGGYNVSDGTADGTETRFTGDSGEWAELRLPTSIKLTKFNLKPGGDDNNLSFAQRRFPKVIAIYGYNGTSWDRIQEYTTSPIQSLTDIQTFHVSNPTTYHDKFVLIVKQTYSVTGVESSATNIGEWELYGYEEGSGSLDTTLKSVYNVPATSGTQLEVYYDARGESTVQSPIPDLSPNTNTGAVSGHSPTLDSTDGITSFVVDGTDDYITSTLTGLSSTQYTMAGWIKVDTLDSTINTFFGLGDWASGNGRAVGIAIDSSNRIGANVKGVTDARYSEVTVGKWYHVVADFTSDNDTHLYVNGKLVDTVAGTTFAIPTNPPLFIGSRGNAAGTVETARLFPGSIANFRLYSKALNADQVKELYDYQKDYFLGSKSQVTLYKGHLGVGVTEPSGQLELAGDERIQAYPSRGMTHPDGTATGTHTTDLTKNITYIEGHGEFKASASLRSRQDVDYDGQQPYNAFDYTTNSYLLYGPGSGEDVGYNKTTGYYEDNEYQLSASSGTPYGHWLQLEMPYKINVKSYFIQH